jgi:hypothetical protein
MIYMSETTTLAASPVPPTAAPPAVPQTAPPAAPPAPAGNWYDGKADPETIGMWQNKGWVSTDPAVVALAASKAYLEAQRFIGVPHDELVRFPKSPVAPEWQGVWDRLGVPKDASGYDLTSIKRADGQPLDAATEAALRAAAIKAHVPVSAMPEFAGEMVKYLDSTAASHEAELAATLAAERDTLQKNWGTNFEINKYVAAQGARALGLDDTTLSALEKTAGYAKTMEALRRVGQMNGEDKYIAGTVPAGAGVMTRDQAYARKAELMRDSAFTTRLMAGDAQAQREMLNLNMVITGSSQ